MKTLDEIAIDCKTDKASTWHYYTKHYARMFEPMRLEKIKLFEIGVLGGASVKMWEEYFPEAEFLYLDIDPNCKQYETDRSKILIGSQDDEDLLKEIGDTHGHFDIIIDDGSHKWPHQIASMVNLFDYVKPKGYYVIEDLQCHYYPQNAAEGTDLTSVDYLRGLIVEEVIFNDPYACANVDYIEEKTGKKYMIESMTFMKDICFIEKR